MESLFYDTNSTDIHALIEKNAFNDIFFTDYESFYPNAPEWVVYKQYCRNDDELLNSLTGENKYEDFHKLIIKRIHHLIVLLLHEPSEQQYININNEFICRNFTLERYYQNMFMKLIIIDKTSNWLKCRELIDEINKLFMMRMLTAYTYGKIYKLLGIILACFNDINAMNTEELKSSVNTCEISEDNNERQCETCKIILDGMQHMYTKTTEKEKDITNERGKLIRYAIDNAVDGCPIRDIIFEQFQIGKEKGVRQFLTFAFYNNAVKDLEHLMMI